MSKLRVVLAAIAVTVFGSLWGWLTCGWLFNWVYQLPPVTVWRAPAAMTPTFWTINLIGNVIMSFIFVLVLLWIAKGLPGKWLTKGISFGFIVWLVGILPGMFATAMFMSISPIWIVYTTINQLIALPLAGLIAASIALSCHCKCGE